MIVGRLIRSLPLSSPSGFPVCLAALPRARLCETHCWSADRPL